MPLFALTSMFSFTLRPKCARRTRKAAWRSGSSSSSSQASTPSASARVSWPPASALSARVSKSGMDPLRESRPRPPRAGGDEEAAGALDENGLVALGDPARAGDDVAELERRPFELGRDERCERRRERVRRDLLGRLGDAGPALQQHRVAAR